MRTMADGSPRFLPTPYAVPLVAGETYHWCTCGLSKSPPLCDRTAERHEGCQPTAFVAPNTETALLCGCHATNDPPFCDGTHNVL